MGLHMGIAEYMLWEFPTGSTRTHRDSTGHRPNRASSNCLGLGRGGTFQPTTASTLYTGDGLEATSSDTK